MNEDLKNILKEKRLYNVYFDSVMPSSDDPDGDYYDEIIYYDGGGVEGHGNPKEN